MVMDFVVCKFWLAIYFTKICRCMRFLVHDFHRCDICALWVALISCVGWSSAVNDSAGLVKGAILLVE